MTFNGSECCKINFNVHTVNGIRISFVKCPKTRLKPFCFVGQVTALKKKVSTLQTSPFCQQLATRSNTASNGLRNIGTFDFPCLEKFRNISRFYVARANQSRINCKLINSLLFYLEFRLGLVQDDLWFTGN